MSKNSAAKLAANNRYVAKNFEIVTAKARKTERLNDLINLAAQKTGTNKTQYILNAIRSQLKRDQITLDDLPGNNERDNTASTAPQPAQEKPKELSFTPMTEEDEDIFERLARQEKERQREEKRRSGIKHF